MGSYVCMSSNLRFKKLHALKTFLCRYLERCIILHHGTCSVWRDLPSIDFQAVSGPSALWQSRYEHANTHRQAQRWRWRGHPAACPRPPPQEWAEGEGVKGNTSLTVLDEYDQIHSWIRTGLYPQPQYTRRDMFPFAKSGHYTFLKLAPIRW